jgi:hypothetical protein
MAEAVFWIALGCTAYVYAGYPLLLFVWRRLVGFDSQVGSSWRAGCCNVQRGSEKVMRNMFQKLLLVPFTFVLMNWAAVAALYYFSRGSRDLWSPAGARHS